MSAVYVTVALNWLIILHVLLIRHYLTIFLFPNMKNKPLGWKQYRIDDEIKSAVTVEDFFEDQDESFYTGTGIQALQHRWEKCVDRRGDYVEKYTTLFGQIRPLHNNQPMKFSAHPRRLTEFQQFHEIPWILINF